MRALAWLALGVLALAPAPAHAVIGTLDAVPAATILVPYFEVDLSTATQTFQRDVTVSLHNAGAGPALTNVTVWSDLGFPVLRFNLFLAGHDVESFSMRQVLLGTFPATTAGAQAPSCGAFLPPPAKSAGDLEMIRKALQGQPTALFGNKCVAGLLDSSRAIVRGYVTIDTVKICSALTPADAGYFATVASDQNALLATFADLQPAQNSAAGENAVHVEASATDARTSTAGKYTFYGRFLGWSAADHREPLATRWHVPFVRGATELIVWRDPQVSGAPFFCGVPPAPLAQEELVAFDTDTTPTGLRATTGLGAVASRTLLPSTDLTVAGKAGWILFSSNLPGATAGPPGDPTASQSVVYSAGFPERGQGRFAASIIGTQLDSATNPKHGTLLP